MRSEKEELIINRIKKGDGLAPICQNLIQINTPNALDKETCNLMLYSVCADGDGINCSYEDIEIDEPKMGRWIENNKPGWKGMVICSECGTYMLETESGLRSPFIDVMRYCPMCGLKMKRRTNEKH